MDIHLSSWNDYQGSVMVWKGIIFTVFKGETEPDLSTMGSSRIGCMDRDLCDWVWGKKYIKSLSSPLNHDEDDKKNCSNHQATLNFSTGVIVVIFQLARWWWHYVSTKTLVDVFEVYYITVYHYCEFPCDDQGLDPEASHVFLELCLVQLKMYRTWTWFDMKFQYIILSKHFLAVNWPWPEYRIVNDGWTWVRAQSARTQEHGLSKIHVAFPQD